MQALHVRRYHDQSHGYAGWVEPEDRAWVLFIAVDGSPQLVLRVELTTVDGQTEHRYEPA